MARLATAMLGTLVEQAFFEADRDFLLAASAWQDDLLQNYRHLMLSLHSVMLAIGSGLFVAVFALESPFAVWSITALLELFAVGSIYLLVVLGRVVRARGTDVNYWHEKLIALENSVEPSRRIFTEFKLHQKRGRGDREAMRSQYLQPDGLNEAMISMLLGKHMGHTRRILDSRLPGAIGAMWLLLGSAAIVRAAGL